MSHRLALVLALLLQPTAALAVDSDGDRVDDAFDVCTAVADRAQRDSDRDGYGDACDADYDGDGLVGISDFNRLRAQFGLTSADRAFDPALDANGDGAIGLFEFNLLREQFAGPPGPGNPDADGDGRRLVEDRCPRERATGRALREGCSALDIARAPEAWTGPARRDLDALLQQLPTRRDFLAVRGALGEADELLDAARGSTRRGDPCEAVSRLRDAESRLATASGALAGEIAAARAALPSRRGTPDDADVLPEDMAVMDLEVAHADLGRLAAAATRAGAGFQALCNDTTGPVSVEGAIAAIDDATGTLELEDGTQVALAPDYAATGALYPGRLVEVAGLGLGDGSVLGMGLAGIGAEIPIELLPFEDCLQVRVMPVQDFSATPVTVHDFTPYLEGASHRFEEGMRLVVDGSTCPVPPPPVPPNPYTYASYWLEVELQYFPEGGGPPKTVQLASYWIDGDGPLLFPSDIDTALATTLRVRPRYQSCTADFTPLPPECSEALSFPLRSYSIRFAPRWSYCSVTYDETQFDLEDTPAGTYRTTGVDQILLDAATDPFTAVNFHAEGYRVTSGGVTSFPAAITQFDEFAIFEDDFYPGPGIVPNTYATGVDEPSGLRWPRVRGFRNGETFQYACDLPRLDRDLVDYCPSPPNSFYELPFAGPFPYWEMGQGNNGAFTHDGADAWAFDFRQSIGTPVLAARSGTVVKVRESVFYNCIANFVQNPDCDANFVAIRHDDGLTETRYVHMPQNGVVVEEGDRVKRGDWIALVGNTGFSTNPHLHFEERGVFNPVSRPLRLRRFVPGTGTVQTCTQPANTGGALSSTQVP